MEENENENEENNNNEEVKEQEQEELEDNDQNNNIAGNNNQNQDINLNNNNENNNVQNQEAQQNNHENNNQINNDNQVQNQNNVNNNNNQPQNNNNNQNQNNANNRNQQEFEVVNIIRAKIKYLREKYAFSNKFEEIMIKVLKTFQDLIYSKLSHSINESLNFITFFKDSADIYSKFAKQIQETNNIIISTKKEAKLNDNLLLDVMQKTQNVLFQNINKISNAMKQNIVNKGPLSNLNEKINKIDQIKKENFSKLRIIEDSRKKLQKAFKNYDKLFESYLPSPNPNGNRNNNLPQRPSLIDTPDFILIIKTILGAINKLILDINLYIIDLKDTFYKINGLFVEITNLVKDSVLIYIKECKSIFNLELTKNFEEIEKYYKKLDQSNSDKIFKLDQIFHTRESEDLIFNLLQQYYTLLSNSNSIKKELLTDRNKFTIKNSNNLFLFFEWLISVSPQPIDISIVDLLIKQIQVKRDPGIFQSWKDTFFMFTKQHHLLIIDKPGTVDNLVKIFELDKTSFRKKTDKKNKNLFELIANRKGKIMDFKGTFLFDALNQQNVEEIPNLVYSAYNV